MFPQISLQQEHVPTRVCMCPTTRQGRTTLTYLRTVLEESWTAHSHTHKHTKWKHSSNAWSQKQFTNFPSINFCHLSTFLSFQFSLSIHFSPPPPSFLLPQSLQSAVSYRIPLQPGDAALQRRDNPCVCVCVCNCGSVCTCNTESVWEIFLPLAGNLISRHTTEIWPANMYPAVCANSFLSFSFFFLNLKSAVRNLGLVQNCNRNMLTGCLLGAAAAAVANSMERHTTKTSFLFIKKQKVLNQ